VGFLGMWCHNAIEVGGGLRKLVVEGVAGEEFGYVAGLVEVDWY
jgi:hypothetical protein